MKRFTLSALALLLAFSAWAQGSFKEKTVFKNNDVEFHQIDAHPTAVRTQEFGPYTVYEAKQGVYHIQDYNLSNPAGVQLDAEGNPSSFNNPSDMYLLVGTQEALLIDLSNHIEWDTTAVSSLRQLVAEKIGDKPLTITFTHSHGDHVGMLPAFISDASVRFALPRKDFAKAPKQGVDKKRYYYIDEGHTFHLGGKDISTLYVPGHTPGSMVFFLNGQNMVFTGDAIGSGHGVWIFDAKGFKQYAKGVPHLISYIQNPANGIDPTQLLFMGGHYWQKERFRNTPNPTIDWQYLTDMQLLIHQMQAGKAHTEPSNLNFRNLDTYFLLNNATIVWNKEEAKSVVK